MPTPNRRSQAKHFQNISMFQFTWDKLQSKYFLYHPSLRVYLCPMKVDLKLMQSRKLDPTPLLIMRVSFSKQHLTAIGLRFFLLSVTYHFDGLVHSHTNPHIKNVNMLLPVCVLDVQTNKQARIPTVSETLIEQVISRRH